jgi:cytochrome P450
MSTVPADAIDWRDPYPQYRVLREERPVLWSEEIGAWLVSRYADVLDVLKGRGLSREVAAEAPGAGTLPFRTSMMFRDPPGHSRLRALVNQAFTPRMAEQLRPRIEAIASRLLDRIPDGEPFDLVAHVAGPLPVMVIAEMLGVPPEDWGLFLRTAPVLTRTLAPALTPGLLREALDARAELTAYVEAAVARRRQEPGDDLLSALVAVEEEGDRLSAAELQQMCELLLTAGSRTPVSALALSVLTLLEHPDQLDRLRAEPQLVERAVEELLRFTAPIQINIPFPAVEAFELHGVRIAAGQRVAALIASANRDPDVFADPETLDVGRDPNPHLTFSRGPHFCLGAPVARLEAQIAVRQVFERFPGLRLAREPQLLLVGGFRGLAQLHLTSA